jgi:hypothetical protein
MGSPSLYSSVGLFVFEAGATASHDLAIEVLRAVEDATLQVASSLGSRHPGARVSRHL